MNEAQAVYSFLSGFGVPAYAASSVPSETEYPYLAYQLAVGGWNKGEVTVPVDLYYRGDSEAAPNAKAREIRAALGDGGAVVPIDGGALWLKRGDPFVSSFGDEGDDKVKGRRINIDVEFLTTD